MAVPALIAVTLALVLVITAAAGIQEPEVHDELTMLSMADIFAQGRLCEPTHRHWEHFEANYLLAQPCTQGKYPPGLPLFMALGHLLTGQFIVGVWISVAVMILCTAYAMYGWLPPRWALVGTALVALRFGVAGDWVHSYWGGSVAAAGGALVFGGVRRLTTLPAARDAALFAAGLMMLAVSRPYEGLMYSLPSLVWLGARLVRPWPGRLRLWRALPAFVVVSAAGLGWHAYYDISVTGSALTMPYQLYERTHSAAPVFVFQDFRTAPKMRNLQMASFEQWIVAEATRARTGWPGNKIRGLGTALWDFLKPTLPVALIGLIGLRRWREARWFAGLSMAMVLGAGVLATWTGPRYLAPATTPVFMAITLGLAGLWRKNVGRMPGRMVVAAVLVTFVGTIMAYAAHYVHSVWTSDKWSGSKRTIREQLLRTEGQDLVFVRYQTGHSPHQEWVYNGADIDTRPIVWARELSPDADASIRRYFQGRKAWVVLVDAHPPRLVQWQDQQAP